LSDEAVAALIGGGVVAVFGLGSLLLNRWFAVKDRNADYREWYRRTLFEKRFTAAGDGYAWAIKLGDAIAAADPGKPQSDGNKALLAMANEARDWYNHNAALLGRDELPEGSKFIALTNSSCNYACGRPTGDIWHFHHEAIELLRKRANELLELVQQSTSKPSERTGCWIRRF